MASALVECELHKAKECFNKIAKITEYSNYLHIDNVVESQIIDFGNNHHSLHLNFDIIVRIICEKDNSDFHFLINVSYCSLYSRIDLLVKH